MRTLVTAATVTLAVSLAPGCKKSKSDKCEAAWNEAVALIEGMSKALGDGKAEKPTAEDKKQFMEKCVKLPPEAVECMSMSKAMDPKCAEIMEKAEAEAEAAQPPVKLEWEEKTVAEGTLAVMVPKGWKQEDFMGARFQPAEDEMSFWNSITLNRTCGGMCDAMPAAEWAKRFEESEIENLKISGEHEDTFKIERDEKLDNGRLIVSSQKLGRRTTQALLVGKWQDGDDHYYTCRVELAKGLTKNFPEFEKACKEMKILHKPDAPAAPPADGTAPAPQGDAPQAPPADGTAPAPAP
jgi:hypothetical protein